MDAIHIALEAVRMAMVTAQMRGDEAMVRQLLKAARELIAAKRMHIERTEEKAA